MKRLGSAGVIALWLASFLAACASVTMGNTWRDPTYEGPPFTKVLVVAWVDQPRVRRTVEDVFVSDLTSRGIRAIASYTLIPDARNAKRQDVVEAAKKSGSDSVLLNRLQGVVTEYQEAPVQMFVTPDPADAWLEAPWSGAGGADVQVQMKSALLMSNLFDAQTGKMVWWGRMDAPATNNAAALARGVASRVLSALRSANLL